MSSTTNSIHKFNGLTQLLRWSLLIGIDHWIERQEGAEALSCLKHTPADLLICSDQLESGDGPSLVRQARTLQPELICLMLIQRPLRSTIEAATAVCRQGLCSRDLVGNGLLLKALQVIDSDDLYIDPGLPACCAIACSAQAAAPSGRS